ncbi:MAG: hypothetical protein DRH12_08560 [Deltaproteobacteria bacterium]|nr:MAG: hypothetical protein DRH12_08560 [Deltaproteobacteria bacterium]
MKNSDDKVGLPIHSCPGKIQIPTDEEQRALAELRKIKAVVREKKALLRQLKSLGPKAEAAQIEAIELELEELRSKWIAWERQKEDAARKRMVLLGHEKPEG